MTRLLVSVRSASEAEAALRGGAALIDVKEPAHGSLGRASDQTIAEVVRFVASRCPVSAALGELFQARRFPAVNFYSPAYVKWGLAGYEEDGERSWRHDLPDALRQLGERLPSCRAVAVSYADWQWAHAPTPEEVCSFAVENPAGAFLLDTWQKDGSTLLDWLPGEQIARLTERCRTAGVPVALAGSLGLAEIRTLLPLQPDWFAVRGSVCRDRQRGAVIDENKVRELVEAITPATSAS